MKTDKNEILKRFKDAKTNNAIEGLALSQDEEALFHSMIEQGLNGEERKRAIDAYLAKQRIIPLQVAAE